MSQRSDRNPGRRPGPSGDGLRSGQARAPATRAERLAGELRAIIGEVIARREIKDPRVQGAGLITITHVRLSGDLRQARALFTVHNAPDAELDHVREGLDHAGSYFRRAIAGRLRLKVTPALSFEIDRVFEQASRIERLLQEIATEARGADADPPTTEEASSGDAARPEQGEAPEDASDNEGPSGSTKAGE